MCEIKIEKKYEISPNEHLWYEIFVFFYGGQKKREKSKAESAHLTFVSIRDEKYVFSMKYFSFYCFFRPPPPFSQLVTETIVSMQLLERSYHDRLHHSERQTNSKIPVYKV